MARLQTNPRHGGDTCSIKVSKALNLTLTTLIFSINLDVLFPKDTSLNNFPSVQQPLRKPQFVEIYSSMTISM